MSNNDPETAPLHKAPPAGPKPGAIGPDGRPALPPPLHDASGKYLNEAARDRAVAARKEPKQ